MVRRLLESKQDLYLRELQAELKAETGTPVSTPHLWKIVGELGFRLKKVAPRRRTRHGSELPMTGLPGLFCTSGEATKLEQ